MSATEFIEKLFGELPELFKNEDELRELWGRPNTRKSLLTGLEERGYGDEQLAEVRRMIDAEKSDLYDVLAYIAFALVPISREERVNAHRGEVYKAYDRRQREFLDFVLDQYVREGVQELDDENADTDSYAAFWTYYTTEFLRLRLGYEHSESDVPELDGLGTAWFELNFVFGSHPVEPYWVNR